MEKTIQPDQRYTKGQTVLREEIFVFFFFVCLFVCLFPDSICQAMRPPHHYRVIEDIQ